MEEEELLGFSTQQHFTVEQILNQLKKNLTESLNGKEPCCMETQLKSGIITDNKFTSYH